MVGKFSSKHKVAENAVLIKVIISVGYIWRKRCQKTLVDFPTYKKVEIGFEQLNPC